VSEIAGARSTRGRIAADTRQNRGGNPHVHGPRGWTPILTAVLTRTRPNGAATRGGTARASGSQWLGLCRRAALRLLISELSTVTDGRNDEAEHRWRPEAFGSVCFCGVFAGNDHIIFCATIDYTQVKRAVKCAAEETMASMAKLRLLIKQSDTEANVTNMEMG